MRWAIIQIPSMAIDGPSMPIGKSCDGHRWASMGPSMGLNGVSVRELVSVEKFRYKTFLICWKMAISEIQNFEEKFCNNGP